MTDPRNHVMTDRLRCVRMETGEWALADRRSMFAGFADWPEVVELAQKILAANEAWLDSQTPTLEELNGKYPAAMPACVQQERSIDGFYAEYLTPGVLPGYECARFASRVEALRWLAAKLEELTDGK